MSDDKLSTPSVSVLKYANAGGLEEALDALSKFGQPRLSKVDGGWHCSMELFVSTMGTTLTVRSEFDHPKHIDAVRECAKRVIDVIETMARKASTV